MNMKVTKRTQRERGNAIIELALSVFLLATVMTGVMEFGRIFYVAAEVANAARAGVQWAALNPGHPNDLTSMQTAATTDAVNVTVTATASEFCECDDGSVATCATGTCAIGSLRTYVKVVATAPFNTIGTYPWIPKPMTMSAQATLRVD
jgi:Flp pilus assembly protein TadG